MCPAIHLAPPPKAGGRPGGADRVDDPREAPQGLPPPVAADVRKEPMLDRVPLARPRGKVAGRDREARAIGQLLQLPLPQPEPAPVAAPGIGRDEQPAGPPGARAPPLLPPPPHPAPPPPRCSRATPPAPPPA